MNTDEKKPTVGSSVDLVNSEIERFLADETADAMAIIGDWGSGKTFTWNEAVKRIKADPSKKVARPGYAYVSLFGVGSIAQLNVAIFQHSEVIKSDRSAKEREGLLNLARLASRFKSLPFVRDYAEAAEGLMAYEIRDRIVCFDDLERISPGLSMKELMGFASFLKERRNCKVVFIAHADRLEEKGEFDKLSEKVVDITLRFVRLPEDAAKIAIKEETPLAKATREKCVALGINNIRVVGQIWRLMKTIEPMLKPYDASLLDQAIHSLPLFGWVRLQQNDAAPSEEFVLRKRGDLQWRLENRDAELTPEEKRWDKMLDNYGFGHVDEFDAVLAQGVANGFFDPAALKEVAQQKNALAISEKAGNSVTEAWAKFHQSLEIPSDEVATAIFEAVKKHALFVTPTNLSGAVRILKELGYPDRAKELITHYVETRSENDKMFDLEGYTFGEEVKDEDVRAAFNAKYQAVPDKRDPLDVLVSVSQRGTSRADRRLLSKLTTEEFKAIFKRAGADTRRVVEACLEMPPARPDEPDEIAARARAALIEIGRESAINRLRVRRYGITDEELNQSNEGEGEVKS